jgi:hypothetical protein
VGAFAFVPNADELNELSVFAPSPMEYELMLLKELAKLPNANEKRELLVFADVPIDTELVLAVDLATEPSAIDVIEPAVDSPGPQLHPPVPQVRTPQSPCNALAVFGVKQETKRQTPPHSAENCAYAGVNPLRACL